MAQGPLWVMVAGPYSSNRADAATRAANLRVLNEAALAVWALGHVSIIGVNLALPMAEAAGDEGAYARLVMPLSLALVARCDGCLRIGGASKGADDEVARFTALGRPVWLSVGEVPRLSH